MAKKEAKIRDGRSPRARVSFPPHTVQQSTTIVCVRTFLRPAKAILVPGMYFSVGEGDAGAVSLRACLARLGRETVRTRVLKVVKEGVLVPVRVRKNGYSQHESSATTTTSSTLLCKSLLRRTSGRQPSCWPRCTRTTRPSRTDGRTVGGKKGAS